MPGRRPGPFFSQADEVFYGGAAGGGKSALLCGLAIEEHRKAIIFRREYSQIKSLVDEVRRQIGTRAGYSATDRLWRLPKCSELELGSVPREDDKEKYQGRAHDLKAFDEVTHFSESQYRFLIAWNRSAEPGQPVALRAGLPPDAPPRNQQDHRDQPGDRRKRNHRPQQSNPEYRGIHNQ